MNKKHYMKVLYVFIFFAFVSTQCSAQIDLENKEYLKIDTGFIFYIDPKFPSFVSVKNPTSPLQYADFSTNNLKTGISLSLESLNFILKEIEKYGNTYSAKWDSLYDVNLTIIPVVLNYKVFNYAMRKDQLEESTKTENFDLLDKTVKLTSVSSIPIQINSVTPLALHNIVK